MFENPLLLLSTSVVLMAAPAFGMVRIYGTEPQKELQLGVEVETHFTIAFQLEPVSPSCCQAALARSRRVHEAAAEALALRPRSVRNLGSSRLLLYGCFYILEVLVVGVLIIRALCDLGSIVGPLITGRSYGMLTNCPKVGQQ